MSAKWVFDLKDEDTYWCTADIGWVTGHSYILYGPLSNGASIVMYEGAPNFPDEGRFWQMIEKYKVSIFYTPPPTSHPRLHEVGRRLAGPIRPVEPAPPGFRGRADQSGSLDVVPPASSGPSRCPIVDTWWQTETGAIMISPLPGVTTTKPGSCHPPASGDRPRHRHERRRQPRPERGGPVGDAPALALDAQDAVRRPRALPQDLLQRDPRLLLRRRRRPAG